MGDYKKIITRFEHKAMVKAIMKPEFAKSLIELHDLILPYVDDYIEWNNAITEIFVLSDLKLPDEDFYKIIDD